MKTKHTSPARSIVLAALFLALAFVLPMVTGHLPQVGNMLCPMHFPVLLRPAGFVSTHCLEIGIACRVDVVDSHWFGDRNRVFFCTEGHYFVD